MPIYAHTRKSKPESEWEEIEPHASKVAKLAEEFVSNYAAGWGRAAGLLHDAGKYQPAFQEYLRGSSQVRHAVVGAALANQINPIWGMLLALPIAAHHGALKDKPRLKQKIADSKRLLDDALRGGMPARELGESVPKLAPPWASNLRACSMGIRMLYSALVDADSLATEEWDKGCEHGRSTATIAALEGRLECFLQENLKAKGSPMALTRRPLPMRRTISEACFTAGKESRGSFRLTVPTGGGKTLSGLRFALQHALHRDLKRIIIVIPYTSILEQTVRRYREVFDVLDPTAIIEYHSNLDPEEESLQHRQACENWDAPIVVTTSVQFFETLYANHRRPCRKLHRIAESVVLLDEVQTFPPGMLDPEHTYEVFWYIGCFNDSHPTVADRDAF